ncbi:MAG TPA: hypothetical protein VFC27_00960 [Anaerovoracaceae bacterium]|nr:hypothetical protein [Anaerovoracaceae bacterium]
MLYLIFWMHVIALPSQITYSLTFSLSGEKADLKTPSVLRWIVCISIVAFYDENKLSINSNIDCNNIIYIVK